MDKQKQEKAWQKELSIRCTIEKVMKTIVEIIGSTCLEFVQNGVSVDGGATIHTDPLIPREGSRSNNLQNTNH